MSAPIPMSLEQIKAVVVKLRKASIKAQRVTVAQARKQNRLMLKRRKPKLCIRPGVLAYKF